MVQKTIKVSEKLHKFLTKNAVRKNDTYEEIIWRMLGLKALTKEQEKEIKAGYEEFI